MSKLKKTAATPYKYNAHVKEAALKYLAPFLKSNGFRRVRPRIKGMIAYSAPRALVEVHNYGYMVAAKGKAGRFLGHMHSDNHNIYWLVGYLTWNGLISKSYKKAKT